MRAGVAREEKFTRGDDAAIGFPEIAKARKNDAAMHMTGNNEIEFVEIGGNFWVAEMDWRMDDGDFGLMSWQIGNKFRVEIFEIVEQDIQVLAAGMEK